MFAVLELRTMLIIIYAALLGQGLGARRNNGNDCGRLGGNYAENLLVFLECNGFFKEPLVIRRTPAECCIALQKLAI